MIINVYLNFTGEVFNADELKAALRDAADNAADAMNDEGTMDVDDNVDLPTRITTFISRSE